MQIVASKYLSQAQTLLQTNEEYLLVTNEEKTEPEEDINNDIEQSAQYKEEKQTSNVDSIVKRPQYCLKVYAKIVLPPETSQTEDQKDKNDEGECSDKIISQSIQELKNEYEQAIEQNRQIGKNFRCIVEIIL